MNSVKLLDAGLSTQLAKYLTEDVDGHPLWTARFLTTQKDKLLIAHRDLVRAGSEIMRTATYQASVAGLKAHLGLNETESAALIQEAINIAREAVNLECRAGVINRVLIAGSVGPYGAYLHDGSEYTGNYCDKVTIESLKDWHRPRVRALVEGGVDLLALETVPCSIEAYALLDLLKEFSQVKAWLCFSIKNSKCISNGEIFADVAKKCWDIGSEQLIAIGANCFSPSMVIPLFSELKKIDASIPLIAYPNSGETYDTGKGRWITTDNAKNIIDYMDEWLKFGLNYIGGCCRTSDKDLHEMSIHVKRFRNEL